MENMEKVVFDRWSKYLKKMNLILYAKEDKKQAKYNWQVYYIGKYRLGEDYILPNGEVEKHHYFSWPCIKDMFFPRTNCAQQFMLYDIIEWIKKDYHRDNYAQCLIDLRAIESDSFEEILLKMDLMGI